MPTGLEAALARHAERFAAEVDELMGLVRIPSVSADGFDPAEVGRSAEAVAALLSRRSFPVVEVVHEEGAPPYVVAERLEDPALPTVLLYAHHDVQPPGDRSAWPSPPFEPVVREGRLFGRGAADDKAGILVHAAAVDAWVGAAGRTPLNVKLVVEGEEETGSPHLAAFLARHRRRLDADVLVLADTGNVQVGVPCLTVSLRGLVCVDVEVRALEQSLHSGVFGGPVPDAAMALARMLASLVDADGRIAVPGIAEGRPRSGAERDALAALQVGERELRTLAGIRPGVRLVGHGHPLELCWWEPALTVHAMEASSRAGARSVINDAAWAQVGIRLAPAQDPEVVRDRLVEALRRAAPWGVEVETRTRDLVRPWEADLAHPAFEAAFRALEKGFGHPALAIGCGASIGFVEPFTRALGGVAALLVGVEDPSSNAHAGNESVDLGDLRRAIASAIHLYAELAGVLPKRSAVPGSPG
jgi:acetylornithine deacetylase/succinyl-diaminopimelate desuccinylase-like protein